MATTHDIVIVGDFRFPGGSGSSIESQIRAQASAGYSTALIQVQGPVLRQPHPFNPLIRKCLDEGVAELVDPATTVSAGLTLAFHPQVFTYPPNAPLRIDCRQKLLIASHPLVDGYGDPFYNWATINTNVQETLGGDVMWAPVGPLVRAPVAGLSDPPPLFPTDWVEVIPLEAWWSRSRRTAIGRAQPVIGRHSRPDPLKWPDTVGEILAAYPADPTVEVRILGAGPYLRKKVGRYPENWQVLPFGSVAPADFLQSVDFFVYFHHSRWVEAFGRTILEALASGALAFLPQHFQPLFGDAAVYTLPHFVSGLVREMSAAPERMSEQRDRARAVVSERFDSAVHVDRVERLIGKPRARSSIHVGRSGRKPRASRRRVLFLTSNGIGMGHLSRVLAIATRCESMIEPVVVTMSQAMRVVGRYGMLCHYIPHHGYLKCRNDVWNHFLRRELSELISFHRAEVILFDGNVPYGGLIAALKDNPACHALWCRRAMWRPGTPAEKNIEREKFFHAVIEPGEISASFDAGLTVSHRSRTRVVAPIRLVGAEEMLSRSEARLRLGLDPQRPAVLVQLGAENNNDVTAVRAAIFKYLGADPDIQVVAAEWLISDTPPVLPEGVIRFKEYPLARYFAAFDFAISAAGYNSFHELLLSRTPTVFVPNENPTMDEQIIRAAFAETRRLALCLRARDVYRVETVLEQMLQPDFRDQLRRQCSRLPQENGALEVAGFLSELVRTVRADRPPRELFASLGGT